ncbi:MAG TPA: hypothetical protein VHM90_09440 [Phycisphaerae bacterium]|jgi:hypothetical protein|nr:hypothetical protein [Phycisphaerae bacterium]
MTTAQKVHPHDVGLPEPIVRKRRRSRRLAHIMLTIAIVTAAPGWFLFRTSIFNSIHIQDQPPSLAIFAWAFLIISSATLVIGLWYLLLTQVERIARIVDATELDESLAGQVRQCPACHHRGVEGNFCSHCGAKL